MAYTRDCTNCNLSLKNSNMKRTLLSLMLPLCIFTAKAQITVTNADIASAGTTVHMLKDTNITGVSVGNASTSSSNWDFSSLQFNTKDTLKFVAVAGTPAASSFPSADMAIYDGKNHTYVKKPTGGLYVDGIHGDFLNQGAVVTVNISPDLTLMTFPATLGSTFSGTSIIDSNVLNTFGVPVFDSLRIKRVTTYSSKIDAYGSLKTPSDNYANTLRQYIVQTDIDSVWGHTSFTGWNLVTNKTVTTHTYNWIANGKDYYVMKAIASGANGNMLKADFQLGANLIANITSHTNVKCNGEANGTATAGTVAGTAPFTYAWSNSGTTKTVTNLAAGTYTVTVTDATSNTSSASITITEPASLVVTKNSVTNQTSGNNGKIDISVSGGVTPYKFKWSNGKTTEDVINLAAGSYTVTVTDGNGCTKQGTYNVQNATSVNDLSIDDELKVYPNPSRGIVNYSSSQNVRNIKVIDLSGRIVFEKVTTELSGSIDLSGSSEGVYLLKVELEQKEKLTRILIVK